ncbi:AzlD domain-containing protein [Limisalsivibrio acetivorans]|uniref:AzlD domain-containing protein n=1 Tax=Limisalsivibrio acetivorans TaxID=1304888 RepID=UPI0003B392E3|nr:AzlD domain-containing protein [Limisalsivibrio acetivorans]
MKLEPVFVIILMAAVTYVPRMLPVVFLKDLRLAPWLNRFLRFIPYASLGALIIPGALTAGGTPAASAAGIAVSAVLAWRGISLTAVFASGVAAVYLFSYLM